MSLCQESSQRAEERKTNNSESCDRAGGTQRLPRLIGATRANELIFCVRRVNSAEAARLGVVDYAACGERGDAEEKALSLAREIIPQSHRHHSPPDTSEAGSDQAAALAH
eukprot:454256_1